MTVRHVDGIINSVQELRAKPTTPEQGGGSAGIPGDRHPPKGSRAG
jgi:hypothetical protein